MSITAQTIIDGAADLDGIKQPGESLTASDLADCLRRLNNFVKQLNNQQLVSAYQAREIFALSANKSTYTIGPGGDFDTTRPFMLDGAAILQNPTITTVTATDTTSTGFVCAGDQTGVFTSGSEFVLDGSSSGANDGSYTVVSSSFSVSTTIVVAEAITNSAPVVDGTMTVFTSDNTTIEIPRTIFTDDAWQAIQVKSLSNSLATGVYFNANYANDLALVQLWPVPNIATNALVLYRRNMLATFASLSATYSVPPGFEEVLEYGLAVRLLAPYAIGDDRVEQRVRRGFAEAMAVVKRTNAVNQVNDVAIDPAWTHDRRGYYNILTGQGG